MILTPEAISECDCEEVNVHITEYNHLIYKGGD